MIEPAVHLSCNQPSHNWSWERISEHVLKSSHEHHVPWVSGVEDSAYHPGPSSGAEEHLEAIKEATQFDPENRAGFARNSGSFMIRMAPEICHPQNTSSTT